MRPLIITIVAVFVASLSAPAMAAKSGGSNARSAVSGKYVTKGYAAKNPRTTVVEQKTKK